MDPRSKNMTMVLITPNTFMSVASLQRIHVPGVGRLVRFVISLNSTRLIL
jgi:hypothetical protein